MSKIKYYPYVFIFKNFGKERVVVTGNQVLTNPIENPSIQYMKHIDRKSVKAISLVSGRNGDYIKPSTAKKSRLFFRLLCQKHKGIHPR